MVLNMRIQYIGQLGLQCPVALQTGLHPAVFSYTGHFFRQSPDAGGSNKWTSSAKRSKTFSDILTSAIRYLLYLIRYGASWGWELRCLASALLSNKHINSIFES